MAFDEVLVVTCSKGCESLRRAVLWPVALCSNESEGSVGWSFRGCCVMICASLSVSVEHSSKSCSSEELNNLEF